MKNSLLCHPLPGLMAFQQYRLLAAMAALLMLALLTPVHAQSFGRTTVGTVPSGGLRADVSRGSKFTLTEAGTVSYLCAYLDGQGGGTGARPPVAG